MQVGFYHYVFHNFGIITLHLLYNSSAKFKNWHPTSLNYDSLKIVQDFKELKIRVKSCNYAFQ